MARSSRVGGASAGEGLAQRVFSGERVHGFPLSTTTKSNAISAHPAMAAMTAPEVTKANGFSIGRTLTPTPAPDKHRSYRDLRLVGASRSAVGRGSTDGSIRRRAPVRRPRRRLDLDSRSAATGLPRRARAATQRCPTSSRLPHVIPRQATATASISIFQAGLARPPMISVCAGLRSPSASCRPVRLAAMSAASGRMVTNFTTLSSVIPAARS